MKNVFFLLVSIIFVSCSSDDTSSFKLIRDLNINRELWKDANITDYTLNQSKGCFCPGPFEWQVFVKNSTKDSVVFDEIWLEQGITYEDVFNEARTIEEIFDYIEKVINDKPDELNTKYDETYGFPTSIGIDYIEEAVDDEIGYSYTSFKILR